MNQYEKKIKSEPFSVPGDGEVKFYLKIETQENDLIKMSIKPSQSLPHTVWVNVNLRGVVKIIPLFGSCYSDNDAIIVDSTCLLVLREQTEDPRFTKQFYSNDGSQETTQASLQVES